MSMEYVSEEFNCQRISLIVHRSSGDKLAVDRGQSLIPPKREKECLSDCFQS